MKLALLKSFTAVCLATLLVTVISLVYLQLSVSTTTSLFSTVRARRSRHYISQGTDSETPVELLAKMKSNDQESYKIESDEEESPKSLLNECKTYSLASSGTERCLVMGRGAPSGSKTR